MTLYSVYDDEGLVEANLTHEEAYTFYGQSEPDGYRIVLQKVGAPIEDNYFDTHTFVN